MVEVEFQDDVARIAYVNRVLAQKQLRLLEEADIGEDNRIAQAFASPVFCITFGVLFTVLIFAIGAIFAVLV
ncbi:hypothetical protein ABC347_10185 [Sphingomonas sp. 1P06PA]|uniref:hypothetical protein n=1 Tax=Sphingomonas sp. 1P06PA TaxID=554121 RepID=UPI0039A5DAC1